MNLRRVSVQLFGLFRNRGLGFVGTQRVFRGMEALIVALRWCNLQTTVFFPIRISVLRVAIEDQVDDFTLIVDLNRL